MKPDSNRTLIPLYLLLCFLVSISIGFSQESRDNEKQRGWLGIGITDVSSAIATKSKLKNQDGAQVTNVEKNSPAENAGIKKGDVITEFFGRNIYDADDLSKTVGRTLPDSKVKIVLIRDGKQMTIQATIGSFPKKEKSLSRAFSLAYPERHYTIGSNSIGLRLLELNPQLGEYFGVPADEGVLVEEVRKNSIAEKAGFKAGDVILRWGTRQVDEISDIRRALSRSGEEEKTEVEILRKGTTLKLTLLNKDLSPEIEYPHSERNTPHIFRFRGFDDGMDHGWIELDNIDPYLKDLRFKIEELTRGLKDDTKEKMKNLQQEIAILRKRREI